MEEIQHLVTSPAERAAFGVADMGVPNEGDDRKVAEACLVLAREAKL
jgi:hypothetical protein